MLQKFLYACMLICCLMGCTSDNSDDSSIFPTPLVPESEPTPQTPPPIVEVPIIAEPIEEKIDVPPVDPIVEDEVKPEPEPVEEEEKEPEDNTAPRLIDSSISHGDVGVNPDTERFIFTFDEEIGRANIKLINNTLKIDMEWTTLIEGKRVILLRLPGEGRRLKRGELYTIQMRWRDEANNWEPENFGVIHVITFITEIKE